MTKSILVMALAATLILTFTMATDAYASVYDDRGNIITIKTNEGPTICETTEGESCGVGTAKAKFRQLVTNVDEESGISTGVGIVNIVLGSLDGDFFLEAQLGLFQYAANGNQLTMNGIMTDQEGTNYTYDLAGRITDVKGGKAKMDINIIIANPAGVVVSVEGLKGIVTETTPIQVQGKGKILCEGGVECGTAKTKIDMKVQSSTQFSYDALGNIKLKLKLKKDTDDDAVNKILRNQEPVSFVYDKFNQVLRSDPVGFVYDGAGNQFTINQSFVYDLNNRLKTTVEGTINLEAPNGDRFQIPIKGSIERGFILDDVFSPGIQETANRIAADDVLTQEIAALKQEINTLENRIIQLESLYLP